MSASAAAGLGKALGGRWTYDGVTTWRCDDGVRSVARCLPSGCFYEGHDGECGHAPEYWLYGDGTPRRAEGWMRGETGKEDRT